MTDNVLEGVFKNTEVGASLILLILILKVDVLLTPSPSSTVTSTDKLAVDSKSCGTSKVRTPLSLMLKLVVLLIL